MPTPRRLSLPIAVALIGMSLGCPADDEMSCAKTKTFDVGVYGQFIYNGEEPRRYEVCADRGRRRVVAFVRFDSDQVDFEDRKVEQVCLEVEGRTIEVVTRVQRKHRGTYRCLSCCSGTEVEGSDTAETR